MEKRISGHTGLMGLFGTPVGHSGSPAMYNFSFQHDGLDYAYMAFDVTEEEMPKAFEAIRLFKMRGGNFTMPCKNIATPSSLTNTLQAPIISGSRDYWRL